MTRWLDLGGVSRVPDYTDADGDADPYAAFLTAAGFSVLTRTRRGFTT